MAANAGRHPTSAQRRILGAPRPTYHHTPAAPPGAADAPGGGLDGRRPRARVAAGLACAPAAFVFSQA